MRPPIQGNDANVVDLFLKNRNVAGPLLDLKIGVVSRRKHGRSLGGVVDASLAQPAAFRAVVGSYFFPLLGTFRGPLLRFWRQGWNLTIWRIDDQRSPQVQCVLGLSQVEAVLM